MWMWASVLGGCGELGPTLDLADDDMVATFPADTTLLAGADRGPALALARAHLDDDRIGWLADAADRVRVGCFDEGCVALLEGALEEATPERLAATAGVGTPRARGLDVATPWGRTVVRRLSPRKAVAGDRAAVARMAAEQAVELDGVDPSAWAGLIPTGEVWVAARGRDALDMLADRVGMRVPDVAEEVRAVAASASADGTVRVRIVSDEAAAWAVLARRELDRRERVGDVVRVGDTVDVTVDVTFEVAP